MKAVIDQTVIAESDQTVTIEGNHYFPRDSVKADLLQKSDTPYTCPWKGEATYWHLNIEGTKVEDAAWSYENPSQAAQKIKSHLAFDKNKVEVTE